MLVGALPKRALSLLEVASAPAEAREVSNNNDVSGGVLVMVDNWDEHMTADGARACKGFLRVTSKIDGEIDRFRRLRHNHSTLWLDKRAGITDYRHLSVAQELSVDALTFKEY